MKSRHYVCPAGELPPGSRKLIQVGKKSIGVFNIEGEYFALLNVCPHQFAPLCLGKVCGYSPPSDVGEFRYEREGEIIRCPWHGWEFDIKTGRSIFNPHKVRTGTYAVHVAAPESPCSEGTDSVETFAVSQDGKSLYIEV